MSERPAVALRARFPWIRLGLTVLGVGICAPAVRADFTTFAGRYVGSVAIQEDGSSFGGSARARVASRTDGSTGRMALRSNVSSPEGGTRIIRKIGFRRTRLVSSTSIQRNIDSELGSGTGSFSTTASAINYEDAMGLSNGSSTVSVAVSGRATFTSRRLVVTEIWSTAGGTTVYRYALRRRAN